MKCCTCLFLFVTFLKVVFLHAFNCCVVSAADGQADKQVGLRDLSEPLIDHSEGQLFLSETFKIIVEEVLCKGTDVTQKVSSEA